MGVRAPESVALCVRSQRGKSLRRRRGQNALEEVNVVPSTRAGVNYGWNIIEGSGCYNASSCNRKGLELPVLEYGHGNNQCSVTGGFVYRGSRDTAAGGHLFLRRLLRRLGEELHLQRQRLRTSGTGISARSGTSPRSARIQRRDLHHLVQRPRLQNRSRGLIYCIAGRCVHL